MAQLKFAKNQKLENAMPLAPEKMQQLIKQRIERVRTKHAQAVKILSDINNKLSQANQSVGHAANALDDAFEVTADMLLEQAQKQLRTLDTGIQAVREELAGLRKEPQGKPEPSATPAPTTPAPAP
jgi:DNA relaxase NicK